jgi:hypothetical protein
MWKPGQSGNPSGVSRVYAEAMEEMSMQPTAGAERTRRWRQRGRNGFVVVSLEVATDAVNDLVRLGWLDATRRSSREAVTSALIQLAKTAFKVGVTADSRSR